MLFFALTVSCVSVRADVQDPYDTLYSEKGIAEDPDDASKTSQQLVEAAELLLQDERPLDARSKLLAALSKDPKNYRAHVLLSGYYLVHVGHFRLALKYIQQAARLFTEQHGEPPYADLITQLEHAQILEILSQVELNLDDYEGALRTLDTFASFDYFQDWYPGSRSWVLMKLGRLDEAIQVARLGILAGAEAGRTLNILGILLSIKGESQASLDIFRRATAYEFSRGSDGQPSTPLNNSGEVYREIFDEPNAERSWLRALALPDGCEHVLPSFNLMTLRLEALRVRDASQVMDNFESCIAQYPLRNGEEHRALVNLARGRIALYAGDSERSEEELRAGLRKQQWFGKIGSQASDFEAAARSTLASTLKRKRARLAAVVPSSIFDSLRLQLQRALLTVEIAWQSRKALQLLMTESDFEDLYVRHSDSLLDYALLGESLEHLPRRPAQKLIDTQAGEDSRPEATAYYRAYLGELLLTSTGSQSLKNLERSLSACRSPADAALRVHLLTLLAEHPLTAPNDRDAMTEEAFFLNRAAPIDSGLRLPANLVVDAPGSSEELQTLPFHFDNSRSRELVVVFEHPSADLYRFKLSSRTARISSLSVEGSTFPEAANSFTQKVFSISLDR